MTQRIVLFGMHGQVGSRLVEALERAGYEVTGIGRAQCDLASVSAKEIAVILRAVEPDMVINAAAYTAVDLAESVPDLARRINTDIPTIIAEICAEQRVPLLHFSTDYVFDGLRGAPYSENAATCPLSVYGTSKRAGEEVVLTHDGHVFRLQWVFDARGRNFFCTMKQLLDQTEEVSVVADQIGAPSHAIHIAEAVTKAVPLIIRKKLPAGVYHLAAGGNTSWHGFACAIAVAMGSRACVVPIVTAQYPAVAVRPKDARLACSVLASHGIAMPHWRDGLTLAIGDAHAYV